MYETILFDLDGTLTDSGEGITKSVQYALKSFGIIEPDVKKLYCFIGPPLTESFMKYYNFTREQAVLATEKYRERFRPVGIYENKVYDGIPELLRDLKAAGKTVALATSKPEEFALRILDYFHLSPYFDLTAGSTSDGKRQSKTDVIKEVLSQLSYTPEQLSKTVMIGDREHDMIGAKNCGIDSIGVEYGFAEQGELKAAGAGYIFDTVWRLKQFLLSNS